MINVEINSQKNSQFSNSIWLVSYPKSGNTWLRFLLGNYLTNGKCDFSNYHNVVPDYHQIGQGLCNEEALKHPIFIKSHYPFTPDYKKVIYLVRDARDVAVSYYFFCLRMGDIKEDVSFDEFVLKFNYASINQFTQTLGNWSVHVNGWLNNKVDDILLVKYENLKKNADQELERILGFSEIEINPRNIKKAIESSSFQKMQKGDRQRSFNNKRINTNILTVRKGQVGDFENHFSDRLMSNFMRFHFPTLERVGYIHRDEVTQKKYNFPDRTKYPNIIPEIISLSSKIKTVRQDKIKVLHIIQGLSGSSGAARSLIATGKYLSTYGDYHQTIISLNGADKKAEQLVEEGGMNILTELSRDIIIQAIKKTDILHFHFWNNPEIYDLIISHLPPSRLLVKFNIGGDKTPHIIAREWIKYADFLIATSPYTYDEKLSLLADEDSLSKIAMIYGATDFERLSNLHCKEHSNFNVGYIGTIHPVKMHPNYLSMSLKVNIPNIKFIVCGNDAWNLKQKIQALEMENKIECTGYVEDIKAILEVIDVFGYPLCKDNYSTAELILQEVMYAGIPSVIFPYGGASRTIIHNQTGLIVDSESEYVEAIEYLYHHPTERKRLGENAQQYAKKYFGGKNAAYCTHQVYQHLMKKPKRLHGKFWDFPIDSGSDLFIESLGETGISFKISKSSKVLDELLQADQEISASTPPSFSVLYDWYQNYYPNDPYLKFWSALILRKNNQNQDAISRYEQAIELGFEDVRVYRYLSQAYQSQLQTTQSQLQQAQAQLQTTQSQLQAYQSQLQAYQSQLQTTQSQLQTTQSQLQISSQEIEAMKSSKFWKLRQFWFRAKKFAKPK